jgi:hypothetical protein
MSFTPWITQSYLKSLTPISQNVDISEVSNHIETAQLIFTRELLGKLLYDDLNLKFIANSLSAIETELFDLLKQAIAYRSSEIYIPFASIKIRNKGVIKLSDEYGQQASLDDVKYLRHELKNRSEYFEKQVQNFLYEYNNDFPLWLKSRGNNGDKQLIYPTANSPYDSDIYIDDYEYRIRKNRYYYGPNSNEPGNSY